MKKYLIFLILLATFPFITKGQNGYTKVTATVKDPTGALYVNSEVGATFFDPGTSGKLPLINGSTFQVVYSTYATDSFAFFTLTLADNGTIASTSGATNTQWNFRICYVDRQTCFFYKTPINCAANIPVACVGSTMDLSAPIQAVAALIPNTSSGGGNGRFTYKSLPFSPTITFSGATNTAFNILLTGNVTSSTVNTTGIVPGLIYQVVVCEDGTGGRTFQWPGVFNNTVPINTAPGACTSEAFIYNGATWDLFQTTNFQNLPVRLGVSGSSLINGDFATNGWGTGATLTALNGTDSTFTFTMTAGTSPSINPTVTLTYHDGAWASIRSITPEWISGTGTATDIQATSTLTQLTLTYLGLPVSTNTYTISVIVTGTSNVISTGSVVNPVIQNPIGPQTVCCFILNLQAGLSVSGALGTFNNGITGTGNIGALDFGTAALNNSHTFTNTQIFPNGSLSLQELVPCVNGQVIATVAGVQSCSSASGINVNGSSTTTPLNLGNLPVAQSNNLLVIWQYSSGNASAEVPISGNGSRVCSVTGTLTNGHVVKIDANGNCIDGGQVQKAQQVGTCTTGSSTYDSCVTVVNWPTSFVDNSYGVSCSGVGPSNPRANITISSHSASSVSVNVVTYGSVGVSFAELDCVGVHP